EEVDGAVRADEAAAGQRAAGGREQGHECCREKRDESAHLSSSQLGPGPAWGRWLGPGTLDVAGRFPRRVPGACGAAGLPARAAARLAGAAGPELAVARVAQAGHDVAPIVELAVERRAVD